MKPNNQNSKTYDLVRTYRRYADLIKGWIIGLIILVIALWLKQRGPGAPEFVGFAIFFAIAVVSMSTFIFIRQGKNNPSNEHSSDGKLMYSDTTGNAVHFSIPQDAYDGDVPALLDGQRCKVLLAPAIASGSIMTVEIAGQTEYENQENVVMLTDNTIFAVQIPVMSGGLGSQSKIADIMGLAGVNAAEQNIFGATLQNEELKKKTEETLNSMTLSEISQKYYSYALPITTIASVDTNILNNIVVTTKSGGKHTWATMNDGSREKFMQVLKDMITPKATQQ